MYTLLALKITLKHSMLFNFQRFIFHNLGFFFSSNQIAELGTGLFRLRF